MKRTKWFVLAKKRKNDEMLQPHFKKRLIKYNNFEGNTMKYKMKVPDGKKYELEIKIKFKKSHNNVLLNQLYERFLRAKRVSEEVLEPISKIIFSGFIVFETPPRIFEMIVVKETFLHFTFTLEVAGNCCF